MLSVASPRTAPAAVGYALRRGVPLEEAELRVRAVRQMEDRVRELVARRGETLPRWSTDTPGGPVPDRAGIACEIERLCGETGPDDALRVHASFLALMFYDDDRRRLPRSWWDTPLGRLCGRVLHDGGK